MAFNTISITFIYFLCFVYKMKYNLLCGFNLEKLIHIFFYFIVYIKALIDATAPESNLEDETGVRMVALFDHEEVGSDSAQGAGSPAMLNTLSRITHSFTTDSKVLTL